MKKIRIKINLILKLIFSKVLPFFYTLSLLGGITYISMYICNKNISVWLSTTILIVYNIIGLLVAIIIKKINMNRGSKYINKNKSGDILFLKQKLYLLTFIPFGISLIVLLISDFEYAIVLSLLLSFSFLFGFINGLFDYKQYLSEKILSFLSLFLIVSFIYAYYFSVEQRASMISIVWIFGFLYLYTFLLITNRLKLFKVLFQQSTVNIKNSKKIHRLNDFLVTILALIAIIIFRLNKVVTYLYIMVMRLINFLTECMIKLLNWLLVGTEIPLFLNKDISGNSEQKRVIYENVAPTTMFFVYIFTFIAIVIVIIFLILSVRSIYKLIKDYIDTLAFNKKRLRISSKNKEYEEINTFDSKSKKKKKNKYMYDIREYYRLKTNEEKIRYLYGFSIERLSGKNINIKRSDTPIEILEKMENNKEGRKFVETCNFKWFTNEYKKVRYGYGKGKNIDLKIYAKTIKKSIAHLAKNY